MGVSSRDLVAPSLPDIHIVCQLFSPHSQLVVTASPGCQPSAGDHREADSPIVAKVCFYL